MAFADKHVTRCWVTGAQVLLREGMVLDVELAASIRRTLAQRLSVVDQLLTELGPRAGSSERAAQLGVPTYAPRVIGAVLAEAYCGMAQTPKLFLTWHESTSRAQARWIDDVKGDLRLEGRFAGLDETRWVRLYAIARLVRQGDGADAAAMARGRIDACVALLAPGAEVSGVEAWLDVEDAATLVQRAAVPEAWREVATELMQRRCARARRVVEAARSRLPSPLPPGAPAAESAECSTEAPAADHGRAMVIMGGNGGPTAPTSAEASLSSPDERLPTDGLPVQPVAAAD